MIMDVYSCDSCGKSVSVESGTRPTGWSVVHIQRDGMKIATGHLCDTCSDDWAYPLIQTEER